MGNLYGSYNNLMYSGGVFVGDIYNLNGDKVYSNGDYYGDHYVSCIALDYNGLTIINSGGIRIFKRAGTDSGSVTYDPDTGRVTGADGKTEAPVFYADEYGNLILTGTLTANSTVAGATIRGSNIEECVIDAKSTFSGEFSGTIVDSDGNTLAYIEDGKMYLTEGTSLMGTTIVDSDGEKVGYIGDDGVAYILVAAQEGSSITGATIEDCMIDSNSTFSGNIIDENGTVIAEIVDGKLSVCADLSEDSELSGQIIDDNGTVVGAIQGGQLWAIIHDSTIESSSIVGSTVEETEVYESCVSLDEYGLTILNSGGITIYSSEYQDARDATFKEITKSDGTKERVLYGKNGRAIDPVFYADDEGNLTLKGYIKAEGGTIAGFNIESDYVDPDLTVDDFYVLTDDDHVGMTTDYHLRVTIGVNEGVEIKYDTDVSFEVKYNYSTGMTPGVGTAYFECTFAHGGETVMLVESTNTVTSGITSVHDPVIDYVTEDKFNADREGYIAIGKKTYNDKNNGVYLGTDGIGLGAMEDDGNTGFCVADTGEIIANSIVLYGTGTLDTCIVEKQLNCNSASVYFDSITFQNGVTISNETFTSEDEDASSTTYGLNIGDSPNNNGEACTVSRNGRIYTFTICSWVLNETTISGTTLLQDKTITVALEKTGNDKKHKEYTIVYPAGVTSQSYSLDWGQSASGDRYVYFYENDNNWDEEKTYITFNQGGTPGESILVSGNILPDYGEIGYVKGKTTLFSIGDEKHPWDWVYANGAGIPDLYTANLTITGNTAMETGAWVSSDVTLKKEIEALPQQYSKLFDCLNPVRYKLVSGTSDRFHTGLIAQDVFDSLKCCGIETNDFAAYVEDENGVCGLRYEELIALLINEVQLLKERVKELECK